MRCPRCGLVCPDASLRCDCGHNFKTRRSNRRAEDYMGRGGTAIKILSIIILCLAVLGIGYWIWLYLNLSYR